MNFCIPCEFCNNKKKKPKEKWNTKEAFSAVPQILFSFLMWSTLGVKTEFSYVTRKHMASFPFRILKPETSCNMFMPSDSMTVYSQKVNGSLRSKVNFLTQERGVLQVKQREMANFYCFFFLLAVFLKIVLIVDYGLDEWRQTFHMYYNELEYKRIGGCSLFFSLINVEKQISCSAMVSCRENYLRESCLRMKDAVYIMAAQSNWA